MERRSIFYWVVTGTFCLVLSVSAIAHLLRLGPIPEAMAGLGYPPFVMTILGTAKLLGVAALLSPGRPILKEWAYAGFTFNLLGATASHLFAGQSLGEAAPPVVLLVLLAVSYQLRPASRRIAVAAPESPTARPDPPPARSGA